MVKNATPVAGSTNPAPRTLPLSTKTIPPVGFTQSDAPETTTPTSVVFWPNVVVETVAPSATKVDTGPPLGIDSENADVFPVGPVAVAVMTPMGAGTAPAGKRALKVTRPSALAVA